MKYATTYFDDVKVGDELPPLVKGPLHQIQLTRYAGASGDFNPIHQDHEFAKAAGMNDVFAHGMLSMGFVGQLVTDWAGAGNVRKLGVRFAGIVRLKDTITCRGRVLAKSGKEDSIRKTASSIVEIEIRTIVGEIGLYQVEMTVMIVICHGDTHTGLSFAVFIEGGARRKSHILEPSFLIVLVQNAGR